MGSFGVVREEEGRLPSVTHDREKPRALLKVDVIDFRVRLRNYMIGVRQDMPIVV